MEKETTDFNAKNQESMLLAFIVSREPKTTGRMKII